MSGFPYDASLEGGIEQKAIVKTDDSILPITIKQVLNMEISKESDSIILIDGQRRKQVSLVAKVLERDEAGLNMVYRVTDYTGAITILQFLTTNDDIPEFNPGSYVYVCGRISSARKDAIHAFSVMPVIDPNQICFHQFQALLAHLQVVKGMSAVSINYQSSTSTAENPAPMPTYGGVPAVESAQARENRINEAVVAFIKSSENELGVSKAEICAHFNGEFSSDEVHRAVDSANFNGAIYISDQDQDRYIAV